METEDFTPKERESETAEFNSALAFLERVNQEEYSIENNLMQWKLWDAFCCLQSYENELSYAFKPDETKKVNEIKAQINQIFITYPGIGRKKANKYGGGDWVIGNSFVGILYQHLVTLNKYLRIIKHRAGMGMPGKGDQKLF